MKITYEKYFLEFNEPFVLSVGSRTHTPSVFVQILDQGHIGYGEATLPPYLPETQESVCDFIGLIDLTRYTIGENINEILYYVNSLQEGNNSAKAAVDMALHDLWGKVRGKNLQELWNMESKKFPLCTYTIGITDKEKIEDKLKNTSDFKILKIKLGGGNDKEMIETIKSFTDKPFCVDVNQGWKNKNHALDMIHWLTEKGAILIEQPMPKTCWEEMAWLKEQSRVPLIADEAIRTLADVELAKDSFDGINIKLMKCGGLHNGKKLAERAKALNLKILVGCMSESSCGVTAAAHLTPYADWADLDGPYLIKNDPFSGMKIVDGRISISNAPGLGISPRTI